MSGHTVFIADDYDLSETMAAVGEKLAARGIRVIHGPRAVKGVKLQYPKERYAELFGEAEVAMFSSRSVCSREVMMAAPRLRGIVNPTIGVDTVDVDAANELAVIVGNGAIHENYTAMAESSVMLMLMLLYNPKRSEAVLRNNLPKPSESEHWQHMLYGRTVGLIGLGRIARGVAERLAGWHIDILTHAPDATPENVPPGVRITDLDTLYKTSDIVGLFAVVNEQTRNMIDERALSLMKPTAYLINTARGQLVDEAALYRALAEKRIAGAALDTFQAEPLPADSPLRGLDNVILTPHLVGHTLECQLALPDVAVENIVRILNGQPPVYCVNPDVIPRWQERIKKLDAARG